MEGFRDHRELKEDSPEAATVRHNIRTQLERESIDKEQATTLAIEAGFRVYPMGGSSFEDWKKQFDEPGPPLTEEELLAALTSEAQRRPENWGEK